MSASSWTTCTSSRRCRPASSSCVSWRRDCHPMRTSCSPAVVRCRSRSLGGAPPGRSSRSAVRRSRSPTPRSRHSPDCSARITTACDGLAGWPSLVRLVLSAPPGATRQFLWEEIVAGLSPAERSGLLALAVLGSGSASEVALVAGHEVDIDRLVGFVPLLHQDAHGTLGAHQLWEDAAERIFPAAEVLEARRRALHLLLERGETVRMGSAAVRWGDADMFRLACVSLVRESLGALPTDTAARWLASTPTRALDTPEHRLLGLAVRHAQQRHHDNMDSELDALEASFVQCGDDAAQAVTLALGAVSAHARGDSHASRRTDRAHPSAPWGDPAARAAVLRRCGRRCVRLADRRRRAISPDDRSDVVRSGATARAGDRHPTARDDAGAGRAGRRGHSDRPVARSIRPTPTCGPSRRCSAGWRAIRRTTWPFLSPWNRSSVTTSIASSPPRTARAWPRHSAIVRSPTSYAPTSRRRLAQPLDARDSAIAATAVACCRILDHDEEAARVGHRRPPRSPPAHRRSR